MPANAAAGSVPAPIRSPFLTCLAAWLVPGAGHLMLGKRGRAAIIFGAVVLSFTVGLLMHGPFFEPTSAGDLLSRLIQYGGFIGDLSSGLLYIVSSWLGYGPPQSAGHNADYGSKFLVCAGLMNILAMVDAYEIATRQKE